MSEINNEMLAALKITQRFLARNTPIVNSDHPTLGEQADRFDALRGFIRRAIGSAEQVRKAEGLAPLELTEEQYQQALS